MTKRQNNITKNLTKLKMKPEKKEKLIQNIIKYKISNTINTEICIKLIDVFDYLTQTSDP